MSCPIGVDCCERSFGTLCEPNWGLTFLVIGILTLIIILLTWLGIKKNRNKQKETKGIGNQGE